MMSPFVALNKQFVKLNQSYYPCLTLAQLGSVRFSSVLLIPLHVYGMVALTYCWRINTSSSIIVELKAK